MSFLTYNQLNNRDFQKAKFVNESRNFSKQTHRVVFISYRRKDKPLVVPIVDFLRRLGANVYIDYLDDALPDTPSTVTATKLRGKIKQSAKFILVVTPNSSNSQWIPWELGLGDGFDGYENTIILPLVENQNKWDEQEYFEIYGYINKTEDFFPEQLNDWQVTYPNSKNSKLSTWLNQ